jgi:uncharacterized protein YeaO (DUF488 family)
MTFQFRTVQLGTPRQRNEGLRIGTVRRVPRGVRKEDYQKGDWFDVWLPILAPSQELLSSTKGSMKSLLRRYRSEMNETGPRQVLQLLAEMAQRTPMSIGCYCANEAWCHRSVLGELIRTAAGEKSTAPLFSTSIYTIRKPSELQTDFVEQELGFGEEGRPWTSAKAILIEAESQFQRVPIIFGDATDCSKLIYWGYLDGITMEEGRTTYYYSMLKRIKGKHSPQELELVNTGEAIAENFIRPYALVRTPRFVS